MDDNLNGTLILQCPKCQLKWMEKLNLPMAISAAMARIKSFSICPDCGNKKDIGMLTEELFRDTFKEMTKLKVTRLAQQKGE